MNPKKPNVTPHRLAQTCMHCVSVLVEADMRRLVFTYRHRGRTDAQTTALLPRDDNNAKA